MGSLWSWRQPPRRHSLRGRSQSTRAGKLSRKSLQIEPLEGRIVLDSTVVFNEVMYNPVEDDGAGEWIELYNQLNTDMDVSEWRLDGAIDFTFPDGTTVPGRGFLVVAASPNSLGGVEPETEVVGPFSGALSNSGEEIRLYNNDNRLMNALEYGDGGKWPVGPDGGGVTLAKADELTATEDVANWTFSPELGGTPGKSNFIERDASNPDLATVFAHAATKQVLVPTNGSLGDAWKQVDFDDATWISGTGGVGYERGSGYESFIGIDIDSEMDGRESAFVRIPFTTSVAVEDIESLVMDVRYDDGFVAYLNGTEVTRANMPATVDWDTGALGSHNDGEAVAGVEFDITAFKNLLNNNGDNVLAFHAGNTSLTSSDFLISAELGYVPRAIDGGGPTGGNGIAPFVINEVTAATGTVSVELRNISNSTVNIEGVVLAASGTTGGEYVFPSQSIPSGGYAVVSEIQMGIDLVDNEKLFLYAPSKTSLYDARPVTNRLRGRSMDFDGAWLYPETATLNADNSFAFETNIVINEIMYNAQPQLDNPETGTLFQASDEEWIELYNRGTASIDLTGWEFRDAVRYTFDPGTMLAPGQYLVVAKDAATLSQKYPGITIVGDFRGSLGNVEDNIVLVDAASNPADSVHYFERGQWPSAPDAGGSTLELRNPDADNSKPNAWAASDETTKSEWRTFSVRRNSNEPLQFGTAYNEFIFGLLDGGEFLIDDIEVIESPNSTNMQVIQNGTFEGDSIGSTPSKWRLIGTHRGTVTTDPDDPSNRVLHVVAAGPQQHVHDHAETTFIGNRSIRNGQTYEIRFRAKWLSGSRQLNSRLYFNRASTTAILDAPMNNGTPGGQNSTHESNIGPTYSGLVHSPLIPAANQAVTVSILAEDPDTISSMTLRWRGNSGGWTNVSMTHLGGGEYTGQIPGQTSNQVVQFYVEGRDALGALTNYPVRGEESRALYRVNPSGSTSRPVDTLHVIMRNADNSQLFSSPNRMSNNYAGGTLIQNGSEVFYDVQVRQIGSRYIRPNSGLKVKLNPEHRYLGVHDSIRLDMNGLDEIIYKQMVNRAGGSSVSLYDDVAYMVTQQHGSRTVLLGLARYEDVFLKEQFPNGGDGTKFELDDITYPTDPSPSPEGLKTGTGVSPQDIRYRGSDLENYRGQLLIRNNRSKDDYEPLVEFARVINLNGTALANEVEDVMDVDLWMRHYATQSFLGNWDTYGFRRPKNIRLYIRAEDGKVIPLYWDSDLANLTEPLIYNGGETRLDEIRNIPRYERLFWGHMWDLTNRAFNADYADDWAAHYSTLGANANGRVSAIGNRYSQARSQAMSAIPVVPFQITTNNGNPTSINDSLATISGNGWIDVREIRHADTGESLEVTWTDDNSWQVQVPVSFGENTVALEAFDFAGNAISADTITITSTATTRPLREFLRIAEIHYNPNGTDETEFIELVSIAESGGSMDLSGVRFTDGVGFDFSTADIRSIGPGERLVVVRDPVAFTAAYGGGIPIAGTYTGALANSGETIELRDSLDVLIHNFSYRDGWYASTDDGGFTLTTVDATQDLELWDRSDGWRPSESPGGTPGADDSGFAPNSIVINEVSNHATESNWLELHNTTPSAIDIGNWFLSDEATNEQKYRFSSGTVIPANGFFVIDEDATFGSAEADVPFALNRIGGQIRLRSGDADGALTGYEHRQNYDASSPNLTHGLTGTSNGLVFTVLAGDTRGTANAGPSIGPVVINEIMYNHAGDGVDFIELKNLSNTDISLGGDGEEWQISNGLSYTFPAGASISANGFALVVEGEGSDPSQADSFRSKYGVPANVPIFVYDNLLAGSLDNGGERITIGRTTAEVSAPVPVDSLRYNDRAPWPETPDGTGPSLSKLVENAFGDDPANWAPGSVDGSPGVENLFLDETPPSDPADLVGAIIGNGQLVLAWSPAFDNETGIEAYNIYQDGELLTTSPIQFYSGAVAFENGGSATFAVSAVNSDGIESNQSNVISIGSQSVSFQQGVGGYTGASDSEIREGSPTQNNGLTDTSLEVDGEDGGSELAILMKWDNLQIPNNAQVVGASITLNITNSGAVYDISQVKRSWNEGQVTWNQAASGQNWQTPGAKGSADSGPKVGELVGGVGSATIEFDAAGVAMVESWLASPETNHGILFDNPGGATDGVDIDSRETGNASNRPELTIQYLSAGQTLTTGDYTLDGVIDHRDIATMCRAIAVGSVDSAYSLDGNDGPASQSDMDVLIHDLLGTNYGDINLNGVVDTSDFIVWRANRFEAGRDWSTGDMNCDGGTDGSDFNLWNENRFFAAPQAAQPNQARTPRAAIVNSQIPTPSLPIPTRVDEFYGAEVKHPVPTSASVETEIAQGINRRVARTRHERVRRNPVEGDSNKLADIESAAKDLVLADWPSAR